LRARHDRRARVAIPRLARRRPGEAPPARGKARARSETDARAHRRAREAPRERLSRPRGVLARLPGPGDRTLGDRARRERAGPFERDLGPCRERRRLVRPGEGRGAASRRGREAGRRARGRGRPVDPLRSGRGDLRRSRRDRGDGPRDDPGRAVLGRSSHRARDHPRRQRRHVRRRARPRGPAARARDGDPPARRGVFHRDRGERHQLRLRPPALAPESLAPHPRQSQPGRSARASGQP
jgi:hypothetical protein